MVAARKLSLIALCLGLLAGCSQGGEQPVLGVAATDGEAVETTCSVMDTADSVCVKTSGYVRFQGEYVSGRRAR
jgi:hypothetical protein